jgi:hypothetical protein
MLLSFFANRHTFYAQAPPQLSFFFKTDSFSPNKVDSFKRKVLYPVYSI